MSTCLCFITLFSFSGASAFCLSCADCKHRSYVSFHTRSAACISGALGHMLMMCWLYLCLSWMFPNHIKVTVISLAFLLCNPVCLEMRSCLHSLFPDARSWRQCSSEGCLGCPWGCGSCSPHITELITELLCRRAPAWPRAPLLGNSCQVLHSVCF